jgi:hypothetical protein
MLAKVDDALPAGRIRGEVELLMIAASWRSGVLVLVAALVPVLGAVWGIRWFVTQDGSAHLYNAHIIASSLGPNSPFAAYYTVRWEALPNWSGHLVTAVLVSLMPAWAAGPAITTLTLVGFAASIVWLRMRVTGPSGLSLASVLAVLLSLNFSWLLGFSSFMLGACLFPITLGIWWGGRERFGWGRAAAIAVLMIAGYLCHLVSLGLTALGLIVLALTTPGRHREVRFGRTLAALLPLLPLGLLYHSLSKAGGPMQPLWGHLADPLSPAAWAVQMGQVDPITLTVGQVIPLTTVDHAAWSGLFKPMTWLMLGFTLMWYAAIRRRRARTSQGLNERMGWAWLAALLLIAGIVGPDSLGASHGEFLQQRVMLLGLVALVPIANLDAGGWSGRLIAVTLVVALGVQSAIVWDYALTSRRTVGAIMAARDAIGRNQRVATLLVDMHPRFRSNPLLHADNLLGIGTGNIVWNNYETRYYYFPVQFRPEVAHPTSSEFEQIADTEGPENANLRASWWQRVVDLHVNEIDAVVVWGSDPLLDAINEPRFDTVYRKDDVRVLRPAGLRPVR